MNAISSFFTSIYNRYSLKNSVVIAFGVIGLSWYYICLFGLGNGWPFSPNSAELKEYMSLSVTTISVSLATFVGMLLGSRRVSDAIGRQPNASAQTEQLKQVAIDAGGSMLQWISVILYAASLPLALYFWHNTAQNQEPDPAIVNLGKSLLGVIGGALAVILNIPNTSNEGGNGGGGNGGGGNGGGGNGGGDGNGGGGGGDGAEGGS